MSYLKRCSKNLNKILSDEKLKERFENYLSEGIEMVEAINIIFPKKIKKRDFYKSQKWREIRYEVLKENKGKCCLCGRSAKDGVILHVDHIIPLSVDWEKRLDKNNLQVLCDECNMGKLNKDTTNWK